MTQLTPQQRYQEALNSGLYEKDPAQAEAMQVLQKLYLQVLAENRYKLPLLKKITAKHFEYRGVYLYGAVGAGKTWLMDMFYQSLPVKKRRMHFHHFMREVHLALKLFQGQKNPLEKIAKNLAAKASVICFDELFVNDITDAMLLGELFRFMFEQGVIWVMTSNCTPDMLYRNGLQRARFLPAIELLKTKMHRVEVKSLKDYRWRDALSQGVYFYPLNVDSQKQLNHFFSQVTAGELILNEPLTINQRIFDCICHAEDVLWCRFDQLCHTPRSVQDYVTLAQQYKLFIVDEVPIMPPQDENGIWYFISLVDVLYDAHCRLVLRCDAPIDKLYQGEKFNFEFQRTLSRLQEMQTQDYWV